MPGGSANAYDYVYQDPINNFDLDGRMCFRHCHWKHIIHSVVSNPIFQAAVTVAVCAGTEGIGCAAVNYGFAAYNSWSDCHGASVGRCAASTAVNFGLARINYRGMRSYRGEEWRVNRWGSPILKHEIRGRVAYGRAFRYNSGVAAATGGASWAYHHWLD